MALTALFLVASIVVVAFVTPVLVNGTDVVSVLARAVPGFVLGVVGVFLGWISWWGAVEPLPPREQQQVEKAVTVEAAVACAICGGAVAADVRHACQHGCGKVFHAGCQRAKAATYRGDGSRCAVCNQRVA